MTDLTSRQRGRPVIKIKTLMSEDNFDERERKLVPDDDLTPGQIGLQTISHKTTLTLTLDKSQCLE
jgi:hypothetical protein